MVWTQSVLMNKFGETSSVFLSTSVFNCPRTSSRNWSQIATGSIQQFTQSHDRFLVIDGTVYHVGASLKDLGKKWFAFSKMTLPAAEIESRLG